MNLTKCFVAGLCLTAMTASAVSFKANSFETGEPGTGWSFDGVKDWDTTGVRVDGDASLEGYTAARPMTGVTSNKVLKLDTEGGVWTNTVVGASFPVNGNKVFSDMLVKFVPSEELPAIGSDIKLAIAVLAGEPNKLAISVIDQGTYTGVTNVWIVTDAVVDTNVWCRLTIEMGNMSGSAYANVKTNGALVNLDPYFVNQGDYTLNSIGFQGTGYIDEVVVRDDDPISTGTLLILSFTAGTDIASVLVGGNPKNSGDTVASGSDLVITAAQWKEIASVSGAGVTTEWTSGGLSNNVGTVKVTATSTATVTITAQAETSTTPIGGETYFSTQPSNKVASWALANGVTTLSNVMYDQYLFNIPTNVMPSLFITSIAVSNSTVTVAVQTTNNVDLVTGINGTLKIKAYPVLGATPEIFYGVFTGTTNITVFTQDIGTNKFVKAAVE